jgi:hypothetical protein
MLDGRFRGHIWTLKAAEACAPMVDLLQAAKEKADKLLFPMNIHGGKLRLEGVRRAVYHGKCLKHEDCTFHMRFSVQSPAIFADHQIPAAAGDQFFIVEERGIHTEKVNLARMKRFWCAKYGALTAAKALLQMTIDEIPIEERPTMSSISNRRTGASGKKKRFNGTFCSSLVAFCNAPPFPVKICGVPVISEEHVRIRFCNQTAFDLAAKYCREWSDIVVVQDATFKTNHQNLVLHSFSLAGLVTYRGDIHMRAFPIEFLLAHREDNAAYHDIVSGIKVDLSHVLQIEEIEVSDKFKDAFMDGSAAARNAIETNLLHTEVHLDLQHEKETIRRNRSRFTSGNSGINLTEHFVDLALASAEWVTDVEFQTCWDYTIKRMESDTDFAMTDEAIRYIKEQVLSDDGKNALWRGGLASTQIGYSPFVSNAEERSWRTLKHLFPKGYQSQDCSNLIVQTCTIMQSWTENGQFDMQKVIVQPLESLLRDSTRLMSERIADASNDEAEVFSQKKRELQSTL